MEIEAALVASGEVLGELFRVVGGGDGDDFDAPLLAFEGGLDGDGVDAVAVDEDQQIVLADVVGVEDVGREFRAPFADLRVL